MLLGLLFLLLTLYYISVIIALIIGDYHSKKEFYFDLIPLFGLVQIFILFMKIMKK
jgi:hypothetical protein